MKLPEKSSNGVLKKIKQLDWFGSHLNLDLESTLEVSESYTNLVWFKKTGVLVSLNRKKKFLTNNVHFSALMSLGLMLDGILYLLPNHDTPCYQVHAILLF
jgi:hypothetical protein